VAKLNRADFVLRAIQVGRRGKEKGLHSKASGLEGAFHVYFGDKADVVKTLHQLEKEGKVALRDAKGALRIYLPADAPTPSPAMRGQQLLVAIKAK